MFLQYSQILPAITGAQAIFMKFSVNNTCLFYLEIFYNCRYLLFANSNSAFSIMVFMSRKRRVLFFGCALFSFAEHGRVHESSCEPMILHNSERPRVLCFRSRNMVASTKVF